MNGPNSPALQVFGAKVPQIERYNQRRGAKNGCGEYVTILRIVSQVWKKGRFLRHPRIQKMGTQFRLKVRNQGCGPFELLQLSTRGFGYDLV